MKTLTGRRLQIARGVANLPQDTVRAYRDLFQRQGFLLPEWETSPSSTRQAETAIPVPELPTYPHCRHRGKIVHQEPCTCGGDTKIPIHACPLHQRCVTTHADLQRIKDEPTRRLLRACDHCGDRQTDSPRPHPLPRHVTRFAVGITSAPRPKPTLARCVASVIAAGFAPTVYAEPGTDLTGVSCPVVARPERLGCWRNYVQTLRDLLASDPEAQAIVVFQDDVIVANRTREFLEHDLWPSDRTGAVSLYSPDFKLYEAREKRGWKRINSKWLMGACAMVYPREVAEALSRHTTWRGGAKRTIEDPAKWKAVDTWIGHAIHAEKRHAYYPNPSLCQHIAETSSIGHGGNNSLRRGRHFRRSGKFAGEAITPFDLFPAHPAVRFNADGGLRLAEPLSVVIPAWNCFDLTSRCLQALAANAGVEPLDVIYVDNGSEPGTVDQVRNLATELRLPLRTIEFPENRGFCPAANAGMATALGHVLLLNNDCYIHPGCLPAMLRHLLSDPLVASVGPLTADHGCQSIKQHPNLARKRGLRKSIPRTMVAGFCQLKRKETLQQIGLLDDNLPHGLGTDDDWCHRARAAGWKVVLALDAFADHDHKSTFRRSGQDRKAMQREAVSYLKKKGTW